MKLFTIFCLIIFIIIDGVQNVPTIRPRSIRTIPLHPVTVHPTFTRVPPVTPSQSSERYSSDITRFTRLTSSPSSSSSPTTPHHSSWRNNSDYVLQHFLRILLYVFIAILVYKLLGSVCSSKKQAQPINKTRPAVINNKMYISTIDGQREEPPPAYVEIHKV